MSQGERSGIGKLVSTKRKKKFQYIQKPGQKDMKWRFILFHVSPDVILNLIHTKGSYMYAFSIWKSFGFSSVFRQIWFVAYFHHWRIPALVHTAPWDCRLLRCGGRTLVSVCGFDLICVVSLHLCPLHKKASKKLKRIPCMYVWKH